MVAPLANASSYHPISECFYTNLLKGNRFRNNDWPIEEYLTGHTNKKSWEPSQRVAPCENLNAYTWPKVLRFHSKAMCNTMHWRVICGWLPQHRHIRTTSSNQNFLMRGNMKSAPGSLRCIYDQSTPYNVI